MNNNFAWVIKDSKNNFCHPSSIMKWDKRTWLYASYKEFGQECRCYPELSYAEQSLDELESKAQKMGLDECFHLEYVNKDQIVSKGRKGKDSVLTKKKIALIFPNLSIA